MAAPHVWRFFRAGGFDQVRLDHGQAIVELPNLDLKLWVALACPTQGLEFDSRTLALLDSDGDGRIRPGEILGGIEWAAACLKTPDILLRKQGSLDLAEIAADSPDGRLILAAARRILASLGKAGATTITLEDCGNSDKLVAQGGFNGDGVVTADVLEEPADKALLADLVACLGPVNDRSGEPGVNQARLDEFFSQVKAYLEWQDRSAAEPGLLVLGDATPAAAAALRAVRVKIDDYFTRCRLAAFDTRALTPLRRDEKDYQALAAKDLSLATAEVAGFPLALIAANAALPLVQGVNPAWTAALDGFRRQVVLPLLGERDTLSPADWEGLVAKFAPFEAWQAAKPAGAVERLGLPRLRAIQAADRKSFFAALIAKDLAMEAELKAAVSVERLLRYCRDLHTLLQNFVNFREFYERRQKALFQAGSLYLDNRTCELCIRVNNIAQHAAMAGNSGMYLAYCECNRKSSGEKMNIVAAFTDGNADSLMVGRNGVFYDRQGRDWDATIVKVLESPISLRQAIWSPYKRFVRLIEEQIARFATAREQAVQAEAAQQVASVGKAVEAGKLPVVPRKDAFDVARFAGIFGVFGLAIGAIGGAAGAMLTAFSQLAFWQMPLAILGIMLVISGPSVLIAWLKLRRRNLGPILDANGWAINARVHITIPFGGAMTEIAHLPPHAERDLIDPYADKNKLRNWLLALSATGLALLAAALLGIWALWYVGVFGMLADRYLPGAAAYLPESELVKRQEEIFRKKAQSREQRTESKEQKTAGKQAMNSEQ